MQTIIRSSLVLGLLAIVSFCYAQNQDERPISDADILVIDFEELAYPPVARLASREGTVVVQVALDESGRVVEAKALSGHDLFVPRCLENVKKWRFQPNARKAALIVYDFRIGGRCSSSANSSSHFDFYERNLAKITGCAPVVQ